MELFRVSLHHFWRERPNSSSIQSASIARGSAGALNLRLQKIDRRNVACHQSETTAGRLSWLDIGKRNRTPQLNLNSIRRFLAPCLILIALILATAAALPLVGRWHWLPDLFAHFVPHYLAVGSVLFFTLVSVRRYRWALLALVIVFWNGLLLSPYLLPQRAARASGGASFDLLQFNISRNNPVPLAAIGYVMSLDDPPDVVVLFETTPVFASDVKRLNRIYPNVAQMPREDDFGMAVLSRLPETEVEFRESGKFELPMIVLDARVGEETVRIYALHPPPPVGAKMSQARDLQLRQLAIEISGHANRHVVVAGDLNTTVWSNAFRPLVETAGLVDAQLGHGYLPTWAPSPYSRWVGVPIDHTLVSERIEVQGRYLGPWLASDHWPVHSRLELR
jgi:endonuclease/exonuclease/phosphatase (EEP) superfamily protein YafD